MLKTAFGTAVMAAIALTAQAQQGPKPAAQGGKAVDTTGKVAIPIGPSLAGEEKLTAQERAERTFLMPPRKKMSSVHPAPRPQLDPSSDAPVAADANGEDSPAEEAKTEAKPTTTTHHTRRHYARRHRSSRAVAQHSSKSKKSRRTRRG